MSCQRNIVFWVKISSAKLIASTTDGQSVEVLQDREHGQWAIWNNDKDMLQTSKV